MQISLGAINHPQFLFAGTFQPRDRNVDSLSQRLHAFCARRSDHTRADQIELTKEVAANLDQGKTVFLSEEMFLVHQDRASIWNKIHSLRVVFDDLPCRIMITVRDPKFAIPSYYQEIFQSLPLELQLNFSAFCRDQRAMCFDYEKILGILDEAGFEDVRFIDFDTLSAGKIDLAKLIGDNDFIGGILSIDKHNSGVVGTTPAMRTIPRVSLKNIGGISIVQRTVAALEMRRWPGYRHCVAGVDRIALRKARQQELIVPSDVAERLDAGYQRALRQIVGADV